MFSTAAADQRPEPYPRPDLLIEAADLARPEIAQRFRILDARPRDKYLAAHVPHAVWVDHDAWSKAFAAGRNQQAWEQRIGQLGISQNSAVVIYDHSSCKDAARIWWILRYWGLKDVRLLNGGWTAWRAADGEVTKEEPRTAPAKIKLSPQLERLATKDQLLEALKEKKFQIIDARSEKEYCGVTKTAKRAGAIPGARHREWSDVIDRDTERFKSPKELRRLLSDAGIDLNRPTVTYCQSGGRAAVMAFTLELLGAKHVRNYYRGWSEWGNTGDTPIERPNAKE